MTRPKELIGSIKICSLLFCILGPVITWGPYSKTEDLLPWPFLWDKWNCWLVKQGQRVLYFLSRLLDMNGQEVKMTYALEWVSFYSFIYNNQSFRNVTFLLCWSQMSLKFGHKSSSLKPELAWLFGEDEKYFYLRKKKSEESMTLGETSG